MYAILGASGHTGRVIVETLLAQGQKVRVVGRSANTLQPLVDKGAELYAGSMADSDFLAGAFAGAKAAYVLLPGDYTAADFRAGQDQMGVAQVAALQKAGVPYVVSLSSVGAHLPEGTGPIAGLYAHEQRLNALPNTHVLHLRPSYFMENLLNTIPIIKHAGIHGSMLRGDLLMPLIATPDIGQVAAQRLLALDFTGQTVQELLGQRDVTMHEVTAIMGRALGLPNLPYVQFSYADGEKGMIGAGMSPDIARLMAEMNRAFNEGVITATPRTAQNTTPTSIESFVENVFAPIFKGA